MAPPRRSARPLPPSLVSALLLSILATQAPAALAPRWEVRPITPAAIAAEPVLADAFSVALVIDLGSESLFYGAGILVETPLPGRFDLFYDRRFSGGHKGRHPEHPSLPQPPPPQSYFDTNVFPSDHSQWASIPGDYIPGTGTPSFGGYGLDVAWVMIPHTGPPNGTGLEVARVTFLSVDAASGTYLRDVLGEFRSSDDPNTPIPIPPMPTPARFIPEPAGSLAMLVAASLALPRRR